VLAAVSGGAIGAAFAASRVDLATVDVNSYDTKVLRPALRTIAGRSMMFGTWHVPALILAVVMCLAGAVVLGASGFGLPAYVRAIAVFALLLLAIILSGWRGAAIEGGMRGALFPGNPLLSSVDQETKLVLQTTDLGSGEATYLTPEGIRSWRWRDAPVGDIRLVRAARAAASFPVVFPAVHLPFTGTATGAPRKLALVDGGVYDNMGTEWLLNEDRTPPDVYKVVVNASGNLEPKRGGFGTFGIGEVRVLMREKDIQYDGSTAPRRRWLNALFQHDWQRGTLVRIDGDLREWVEKFTGGADERAARAREALAGMDAVPDPEVWQRWASENRSVPTSLGKLKRSVALDLARAGYMAAATQTHILEGWPAPSSYDPSALFADAFAEGM
jgi:hypothetical protein